MLFDEPLWDQTYPARPGESFLTLPILERSTSIHLPDPVSNDHVTTVKPQPSSTLRPTDPYLPTSSLSSATPSSATSSILPEESFTRVDCPSQKEGKEILRGDDLSNIILLSRFWPYRDESLFYTTLRSRGDDVLDRLLVLERRGSPEAVAKLELSTKEKLEWLQPLRPFPNPRPGWTPRQTHQQGATEIVGIIDKEICEMFREIPFQRLLRHALGYPMMFMNAFISSYLILPMRIGSYLTSHPEQVDRYIQVIEVYILFRISPPSLTPSAETRS